MPQLPLPLPLSKVWLSSVTMDGGTLIHQPIVMTTHTGCNANQRNQTKVSSSSSSLSINDISCTEFLTGIEMKDRIERVYDSGEFVGSRKEYHRAVKQVGGNIIAQVSKPA